MISRCDPITNAIRPEGEIVFSGKEIFEKSLQISPGCWNWIGKRDKDGYGHFYFKHRTYRAHRYSWMLHFGEIPDGLFVCHRCDNTSCVNPDHLFLGTNTENLFDRHMKGRSVRGEACGKSKITEEIALAVRNAEGTHKEIAKRFGVSATSVWDIKSRRTWKHI